MILAAREQLRERAGAVADLLIGVCKATLNNWMDEHPEFLDAVKRAKAARLRDWEANAINMRANGGGPGGATITIFGLKNMGGDEWSDTQRHEVTGKDGAPLKSDMTVKVDPDTLRDAIKAVRDEY